MKPLSRFPSEIKTPRLNLRVIMPTRKNAEMIFRLIQQNRDYLEAWQGHIEYLRNVNEVLQNLEFRAKQIKDNAGILFGIYRDDDFIGRIRFFVVDDGVCEIGYWLIESENKHGYMSEALSALEKELFAFGFDKIILDTDAGNTRSENVARRNGYRFEKRLPLASWAKCLGGKCDSLIFVKERS